MARESLPPTGRLYRALRNQGRPLAQGLSEWVDNSFGEQRGNADRVWVIVKGREVSILDDGRGPEWLRDVIQIGAGAVSGGYDSGRFGWGGSVAQLSLASRAELWALRADGAVAHGIVDWDRVVEREEHPAADSSWKPGGRAPKQLKELGHGFLLEMRIRGGKHISSSAIRKHLAREFAAGLRAGKRIYWVEGGLSTEITAWSPPDLNDIVRDSFEVGPGLRVELEAGWSDALSPADQGLEIEYGPRRLVRTKTPFQGYRGPPIFGWLRLRGEAWLDHLESEKTGIASDDLRAAVEETAQTLLTPLMEDLAALRRSQAMVDLGGEIADALTKLGRSRGPGKGPGFPDTTNWTVRNGKRKKRDGPPPDRKTPAQRAIYIDGSTTLGPRPWVVDCPLRGDWQIYLNETVPPIKNALDEHPQSRPVTHQILAQSIAFGVVQGGSVVDLGLFTADEYEALRLEVGEEDTIPAVYQRLLAVVSA